MTDSTQTNGHAGASTEPSTTTSKVQPNDVGWQFVPQYYNFMNKSPGRLHCFYNKRSTFLHGEEGEETTVALGQQEIHERIVAIGYNDCKVYINSIDSQSSAGGGVIILVIGEMSNDNGPWRKFTQTFFLAEQPGGYFVLNDIFRYLKEEDDEEAEDVIEEDETPVAEPVKEAESVSTYEPEAQAEAPVTEEPTPEPEPISAPADPDPEVVPVEAEIAAVPDKDIAPEAPAQVESAAPAAEESAPVTNGSTSAPAPAPATAPPAAPAQPAAPAKPKSWASLAAGAGKGAWGSLASSSVGLSIGSVTAAAAAAVAAPVAKKEETTPAATPASGSSPAPRHPFYENALKVQTPHCFVKLPNWSTESQNASETMDEPTVRNIAARFGEVAKVEIVKSKACAFVEFKSVESARKAIIASLSVAQGGEGGVTVAAGQKLNFETRKEKEDRRSAGGGVGAGAGQAGQGSNGGGQRRGGGPDGGRGRGGRAGGPGREGGDGQGGAANRGRGRGRGGAPQSNGAGPK